MTLTRGGKIFLLLAILGSCTVPPLFAAERRYVHIIGSSSIFPFLISVAENMSLKTGLKSPVIESTGTGGGIKIFCSGIGKRTPDIVAASRPMTTAEKSYCAKNDVKDVLELIIGHDGIVLGTSRPPKVTSLSREQLHLILADHLCIGSKKHRNPLFFWSDLDPRYPSQKIKILGPSSSSGTREAFLHHIFRKWSESNRLLPSSKLRRDDVYHEASDQETVIIQKLQLEPEAFGIFSFSFLALNRDKVFPVAIDGVLPSYKTITDGTYPLSRPLYLYAKPNHFRKVKGLVEFLTELFSEDASGVHGYLKNYGFIPLNEEGRQEQQMKIERALTS